MADLETSTSTPRREAAQNASKIISEQLDSDSQTSGPVAEHAESSAENHRPRKRVKSGKGHKSRKATTTKPAASSPRSSPSLAQPDESGLPPTNATSNDASADLDINHIGIDGLSDLTSLSSDEEQSSPDIDVAVSSRRAVLPKPFPLSMVEHSSPIPEASTSRVSRPKVPKASSGSGPGRPRSSFKPSDFDTYVWVLIAPDTGCLYDRETAQDKGLWWPGKIQNPHTTNEPIEVKLYGKGSLSILSPAGNLIPQTTRGTKLKFMKPSYQHPSNGPRKKKQKREQDNMQGIWQAAVDEMKSDMNLTTIKADAIDVLDLTGTTDDEELPLYVKPNPSSSSKLSSVPSTAPHPQGTTGIRNHGKKRKRVNMDSDDSLSDASDSVFFRKEDGDGGEADISLQIPGELVIGRSKNQLNVYWPAKIEAYVPPTKSGLSGKYHVIFLDGTREDIPREWFYTMAEPGFAQCKLGHFESKDPNLVADDDDEEDVEEDRTSPVPQDPPPLKEDFLDLPIAQQFIYTKDILRAILNDKYAPSRQKHDYFIRGGRYRKHVTDQALLRGMMSARDVERLHKIVLAWCLKNLPEDDDPPETDAVEDLQKSLQDIGSASVIPSEPVPDEPSTLEDIVMEEPSIANDSPEQAVPEGPVLAELAPATRLTDYIHPESAIRFTSPSPTDKLVSSPPPEMPPSSNPLSAFEYTSSQSDIFQTHNLEAVSSPPASSFVPSVIADEALSIHNDTERDLSDLTPVEEEDEVNVTKRVFVPFKSLGPLVQVEYCSNVLVPEAIRQILLWRTGERTQTGLLSPEQEQSLYEKGQKLLVERDWVFDVVRLREKQVQNLKVESEKLERRWLKKNGGLSRPRRNVGTRKYAE